MIKKKLNEIDSSYPEFWQSSWLLFVLFIAYTLSFIDRQILTLLVDPIQKSIGLSDFEISLLHGFAFAIFFSIAGLPPLAGFFGKLYILISAIESKLYILSIVAILTSIVSAFYYLRIIKIIFFDEPVNDISVNTSIVSKLIIIISIIFSITLILFVSDILELINSTSILTLTNL